MRLNRFHQYHSDVVLFSPQIFVWYVKTVQENLHGKAGSANDHTSQAVPKTTTCWHTVYKLTYFYLLPYLPYSKYLKIALKILIWYDDVKNKHNELSSLFSALAVVHFLCCKFCWQACFHLENSVTPRFKQDKLSKTCSINLHRVTFFHLSCFDTEW